MERLSWIIQIGSKFNHIYYYKVEAEKDLKHAEEKVMQEGAQKD